MHRAKFSRKILPQIDMCIIASGLQLVIWAFFPGDRSEWVRGWSLHLFSQFELLFVVISFMAHKAVAEICS